MAAVAQVVEHQKFGGPIPSSCGEQDSTPLKSIFNRGLSLYASADPLSFSAMPTFDNWTTEEIMCMHRKQLQDEGYTSKVKS